MMFKAVAFVFLVAVLHVFVESEIANEINASETAERDIEECSCGFHGNCRYSEGKKTCQCDFGFAELDGNCEVCNCGSSQHKCHFDRGLKECQCSEGHYQRRGLCGAIPLPSWEVRSREASSVEFRFYLPDSPKELDEDIVIEVAYRQLNATDTRELFVNGTTKDVYLTIYGSPGTHELRYRMYSNLGRSGWSEWQQFSLEGDNFVDAPIILLPTNSSTLYEAGRIRVKWQAPANYSSGAQYRLILAMFVGHANVSWQGVDVLIVLHEVNRMYYEGSFYKYDDKARYRLTIRAVTSSGAASNPSHVYFRVYGSTLEKTDEINWPAIAAVAIGGVVFIVLFLLSFCVFCCVKGMQQIV